MLRKRSRPVTSSNTKQSVASDHNNNNSNTSFRAPPPGKSSKPTPFLLNSPTIFKGLMSPKEAIDHNPVMLSPSSVLESKPFPAFPITPLWFDRRILPKPFTQITTSPSTKLTQQQQQQQHSWDQSGIGIALIDEKNPTDEQEPKPRSKLVVFGSQLRIQIPPPPLSSLPQPTSQFPPNSPNSPVEFGIKTPRSNFGAFGGTARSGIEVEEHHRAIKESLSMEEMEMSEDYTCVISHGPNPKTTHIFGNCIVESCCGSSTTRNRNCVVVNGDGFSGQGRWGRKGVELLGKSSGSSSATGDFLSFCHHCKKRLGQGTDIYMYRGEKAFCSQECRGQGMLFDGIEN